MNGIWRRLSYAAAIAALAFAAAVPYIVYLTRVAFPERVREHFVGLDPDEVLRADLGAIFVLVAIASIVGSLFAERYRLRGIGGLDDLRAARWLLAAAPVLLLVSYFAFGRVMAERIPGTFPATLGWAFVATAKNAVFDEVVARFGMMTIVAGLAPRTWQANVLQAVFFTALVFKGLGFFGLAASWDVPFVASLVMTFAMHLYFCHLYARYGLLAAVVAHAIVDLEYPLHVALS